MSVSMNILALLADVMLLFLIKASIPDEALFAMMEAMTAACLFCSVSGKNFVAH